LQWLIKGFESQKNNERKRDLAGRGGGREFQILESFLQKQEEMGLPIVKRGKERIDPYRVPT
jgi:hypothetical protein